MLNVTLKLLMLNVVILSITLKFLMLIVVILCVTLKFIMLSDVMLSDVMLSDVMLSDVMLSDVMLSDVMLSVVAPLQPCPKRFKFGLNIFSIFLAADFRNTDLCFSIFCKLLYIVD
jgi:hypothetical protein